MSSLSLFLRTVRRIPPERLLRRLWIAGRRRMIMSPLGRGVRRRRLEPLLLASRLPSAVFPPREHLVQMREGNAFLCQLNRSWPISSPIDWQLSDDSQSTHLERLAFHYLEFLEALEVEQAESIVLDWIQHNPPWQPGYWLDTWNSYAVSIRSVCMMQWLAAHRDKVASESVETVAASVVEQLRFLNSNLELDIRGNHLIKNIKALLWAGTVFDGSEADRWLGRGKSLLRKELESQFLADGMHFELSPAYHSQVFADLMECASVLDPTERGQLVSAMEPAAQVVADLTHPDQRISLFSDGGLEMAYLPNECLDAYQQLGGTRPLAATAFKFPESGYYGIRSETGYLACDCGPSCADSLPAHGHGDILAFEWDVAGRRVVVDAGVREYETGPGRDWNRSTAAHNTVTVGDRDQCEFVKSFRVGHRAHGQCTDAEFDEHTFSVTGRYTACSADGQQVEHARTISGSPASFKVVDSVASRKSEPAVARLLLHHDCKVTSVSESIVAIELDSIRIRLDAESPIRIGQAKWSPNFGEEYETIQLEIAYGNTPCNSRFTLTVDNE